ncbi:hypothetical protein Hanom_Chr01g00002931 [Helianthus anomalus]
MEFWKARDQIQNLVNHREYSLSIDRKKFLHIEYSLRRGKKQLDQLKTVDSIRLSSSNVELSYNKNNNLVDSVWLYDFIYCLIIFGCCLMEVDYLQKQV